MIRIFTITITTIVVLVLINSCVSPRKVDEQMHLINSQLAAANIEVVQRDTALIELREKYLLAKGGNEMLLIAQQQLQTRLIKLDDEIEHLNSQLNNTQSNLGRQRSQLEKKNQELQQHLTEIQNITQAFQNRLSGLAQKIALDSTLSKTLEIRSRAGSLSLIVTEDQLFRGNSSRIVTEAETVLAGIARLLEAEPLLDLMIIGHLDNSNRYNAQGGKRAFSAQRAVVLSEKLSDSYYLSASRITAAGMGDAAPLQSNATDTGRAANRRIEFLITNSVINLLRELEKVAEE